GDWMLIPLENRFPPVRLEHVDGIVLLGGDENPYFSEMRGQPVIHMSARRYIEFARLAREYSQAKLAFTGGSGLLEPKTKTKDAEVAKQALANLGLPIDRIVFEDKSRNTYENAVMTAALVHPTPEQKWLLVTSAAHMPRSIATFRKVGWNIYP